MASFDWTSLPTKLHTDDISDGALHMNSMDSFHITSSLPTYVDAPFFPSWSSPYPAGASTFSPLSHLLPDTGFPFPQAVVNLSSPHASNFLQPFPPSLSADSPAVTTFDLGSPFMTGTLLDVDGSSLSSTSIPLAVASDPPLGFDSQIHYITSSSGIFNPTYYPANHNSVPPEPPVSAPFPVHTIPEAYSALGFGTPSIPIHGPPAITNSGHSVRVVKNSTHNRVQKPRGRKYLNEETRYQALLQDRFVEQFTTVTVQCTGCRTVVRLDGRRGAKYYPQAWRTHRETCPDVAAGVDRKKRKEMDARSGKSSPDIRTCIYGAATRVSQSSGVCRLKKERGSRRS